MTARKPRKLTDTELLDWLEKRDARITRWNNHGGSHMLTWTVSALRPPYIEGEGESLRTAIRRAIKAEEKR